MMRNWKRHACVVGGLVCCAGLASGQVEQAFKYIVEWDHPVLKSGVNTGAVYVKAIPPLGGQIWCILPCGGPGNNSGTSMAFASTIFDLLSVQNGKSGQLSWTVPPEFNIANKPGTPDGQGGILATWAGQYGYPFNANPNSESLVKVLDVKWDPMGDYSLRTVEFATQVTSAKIFIDTGLAAWVGDTVKNKFNGLGGFIVSPLCYADCDANGALDIDDFICFSTYFAIGDPLADCEGDGGLTIDDFMCFQTMFAIGCG